METLQYTKSSSKYLWDPKEKNYRISSKITENLYNAGNYLLFWP